MIVLCPLMVLLTTVARRLQLRDERRAVALELETRVGGEPGGKEGANKL